MFLRPERPTQSSSMENSITSPGSDGSSSSESRFVDNDRAVSILRGFALLHEHKQLTDVTICIGSQEFPCHRSVLAISSPVFMAMFTSNLKERDEENVTLNEMDPKTMSLILDYIYTGEVVLSEDTVQNLLSAANLFQLVPLRTGCADYMIKHVSVSNCIGVYFFAKAHQCTVLASKAKEIINKKFSLLCKEQEFLLLPADKLIEIIKDDKINVSQEETIYEACLAWVNYSLEDRQQYLVDVMKCVRFASVSSYYFCDNIDQNALLRSSDDLKGIIDLVKYYQMLKNRHAEVDLNFLPRKGMSYERGVIIMANPYNEDNSKKFNSMELLLPKSGVIKHLCKLPQSIYMPGACVTGDNKVFLAGGAIRKINYRGPFTTEGVSPNLFMYDHTVGSWQVKSKMQRSRSQFCLVMLDGVIYAIGGQNETDIMDSVEKYDMDLNTWTQVAPLPKPLRCSTAVGLKGRLYVFGGETTNEITKCAYRYDPAEDAWIEMPPMHIPRALAGSVIYQEKIYIIGGNSSVSAKWKKELLPEHCVSSVEIFDPVSSTWRFGPELPNALCGAGVIKYGDTIMVVGGEDDKSWMAGLFVLKWDADREYWAEGHELPTVMSTFGCVVANIPRHLFRENNS